MNCFSAMLFASALTTMPVPEQCPEIHYISVDEMDRLVEKIERKGRDCRPWAVYVTRPDNYLLLRNSWKGDIVGNYWRESVLVHEMVHHLQYHYFGTGPRSRKMLVWQEKEAYAVQIGYLEYKGVEWKRFADKINCGTDYVLPQGESNFQAE